MKSKIAAILTMALIAGTSTSAEDNTKKKPESGAQTVCPLMGGNIDTNQYADHEGQRIYVCCRGCIKPLKQDSDKYVVRLEEDTITLENVPNTQK